MASHASRYEIAISPQPPEKEGTASATSMAAHAVRREWVYSTGEAGASGYARYSGSGIVADIDTEERTVEAITVDGSELPYGWTAWVVKGEDGGAD